MEPATNPVTRLFRFLWRMVAAPLYEHSAIVTLVVSLLTLAVATYTLQFAYFSFSQAANSFELQRKAYEEEAFQRQQSAVSLAAKTIGEANDVPYDVGQSVAIEFLAGSGKLNGHIALNNSQLVIRSSARTYYNLERSSFCGTRLYIYNSASFKKSLLQQAEIAGNFDYAEFSGANMRSIIISSVMARNASFVGVDISGATFQGGVFTYADFQGSNMSNIMTELGTVGVGTNPNTTWTDVGYYDTYYPAAGTEDFYEPIITKDNSINEALTAANIEYQDTRGTRFVDFTGSHFENTDLSGADLRNSNITQRQLNTACGDENTKLPDATMTVPRCEPEPWLGAMRSAFQSIAAEDRPLYEGCVKAIGQLESNSSVARF